MKRLITRFIALSALQMMLAIPSVRAQETWLSISQIREQTPPRWTQAYETPWRTVVIDVAVEIPAVEAFPIIRVMKTPAADSTLLGEACTVRRNESGMLSVDFGNSRLVLSEREEHREIRKFSGGDLTGITAEGSAISAEQAVETLMNKVYRLTGHEHEGFALESLIVYGTVWKYRLDGEEKIYTQPVTDEGNYGIELEQLFHGIPYRACGECAESREEFRWPLRALVTGTVCSEDRFTLSANLLDEVDVVRDDVPILSFQDAKAAIEAQIMSGHLRTIDTLELVYAPYLDPDKKGVFWLLPVWVAKGGYESDAAREFASTDEESLNRAQIVFHAQTGALTVCGEGKSDRQTLRIVTWDDLR